MRLNLTKPFPLRLLILPYLMLRNIRYSRPHEPVGNHHLVIPAHWICWTALQPPASFSLLLRNCAASASFRPELNSLTFLLLNITLPVHLPTQYTFPHSPAQPSFRTTNPYHRESHSQQWPSRLVDSVSVLFSSASAEMGMGIDSLIKVRLNVFVSWLMCWWPGQPLHGQLSWLYLDYDIFWIIMLMYLASLSTLPYRIILVPPSV